MNINFIILFFSSLFAAFGQFFLKSGAASNNIVGIIFSAKVWVGLFCYFFGSALWIYALSKEPLNKVYPFTILTFILVFTLSYIFLKEPFSLNQIVGLSIITLGFIILSFA